MSPDSRGRRHAAGRPQSPLALARPMEYERRDWASFCSNCGHAPDGAKRDDARVCPSCGMGLVLRCPADVAPSPGASFLVVDRRLAVGAVSRGAQRFLGVDEATAIHRPVTELIQAADTTSAEGQLAAAIARAAAGEADSARLFVRPARTFGVRCGARIGPCGPPSAAIVVFEAD